MKTLTTLSDYTHKNKEIKDIRLKRGKSRSGGKDDFFALQVEDVEGTIFVNYNIFNDRIKSFFLGKNVEDLSRNEILDLKWNFVITKGSYMKIISKDHFEQVEGTPEKWYISILEVATPIGQFANNFAANVEITQAYRTYTQLANNE